MYYAKIDTPILDAWHSIFSVRKPIIKHRSSFVIKRHTTMKLLKSR